MWNIFQIKSVFGKLWPLKPCKIELSRRLLITFQQNQNLYQQLTKSESKNCSAVRLSEKEIAFGHRLFNVWFQYSSAELFTWKSFCAPDMMEREGGYRIIDESYFDRAENVLKLKFTQKSTIQQQWMFENSVKHKNFTQLSTHMELKGDQGCTFTGKWESS